MSFVGEALAWVAETATAVIHATGYAGVLVLMALESMIFPVPSEAVMPFAGFLAGRGDLTVVGVLLASSAGSLLGSYLSYLMGAYGMLPLVARYGKYFLIHDHHIQSATRWFELRGAYAIFLCRFVPGVRHVISIPAGAARMPLGPFFLATLLGATLWNGILLWAGYALGSRWHELEGYMKYVDVIALGLAALVVAYFAYEWRKSRARRAAVVTAAPAARVEQPPR